MLFLQKEYTGNRLERSGALKAFYHFAGKDNAPQKDRSLRLPSTHCLTGYQKSKKLWFVIPPQ